MTAHGVVARRFRREGRPFPQKLDEANPSLLFRRLHLGEDHADQLRHLELVRGAAAAIPPDLLTAVHGRRAAAARALTTTTRQLRITPMWRLVVGHGEASAQESGLTLSSTYGVPTVPGSALKGACAAQARRERTPVAEVVRCFGGPRPGGPPDAGGRGTVRFWDALPLRPPRLVVDVLTPHAKPYYDQANSGKPITNAPAEYHNPVPVRFLAVELTPFRTILTGPAADVALVEALLTTACDEWGLGGKTSAGYGYCTVEEDA